MSVLAAKHLRSPSHPSSSFYRSSSSSPHASPRSSTSRLFNPSTYYSRELPPTPLSDRGPEIISKPPASPASGPLHPTSSRPSSPHPRVESLTTHRSFTSSMSRFDAEAVYTCLKIPSILASLLSYLDWTDALDLFNTCTTCRELIDEPSLRDVMLSRFVPGYTVALRLQNIPLVQDFDISLHDLDLLLISQRVPLHKYPIHALKTLNAAAPSREDDEITAKFICLAKAHSRFILLLQSLVHSSSAPLPSEPEEFRRQLRYPFTSGNLRELTFPAPLSYSQPPTQQQTAFDHGLPGKLRSKKKLIPALKHTSHHSAESALPHHLQGHTPRPSADSASSMFSSNDATRDSPSKNSRRLSVFRKKGAPEPPPLPEPRALRLYSTSWRRTKVISNESGAQGWYSDDGESLKLPRRRFASVNHSSDSSISAGGSPSPLSSSSPSESGGSPAVSPTPPRMTSPHDLSLSISRIRAPVLRVFVPCAKLDPESQSWLLCEQQLVEEGLWEHMSTGDLVCNLGFVPPNPDEGSDTPSSGSNDKMWLLFDGMKLVPYWPSEPVPLPDPFVLPSPFYYAHVMPPFSNPVFVIPRLPPCDDIPQLTLMHVSTKVRSPHSPKGYAVVKKYAWTARIVRTRGSEEIGNGWLAEWILEGEGTKEGRKELLDALAGAEMSNRACEVMRERSGGGRIWLRLLALS